MRHTWLTGCVLAATAAAVGPLPAAAADEGFRTIEAKRFGVAVKTPAAWRLIAWEEDDRAFVLSLPQERGSPPGFVACELGLAPESLEEYQCRHQTADAQHQQRDEPRRRLVLNAIVPVDSARFGRERAKLLGRRLDALWEHRDGDAVLGYELRTYFIAHDTLYTFKLVSDQAHFEAYRHDFEDMLAQARITPPETGLQRMPGGYWMQRDFRFALKLPDGWKPAFGPNDKVLLFATGTTHQVFTDNLIVLAGPPRPIDFDHLVETLPAQLKQADPQCEIICRVVKQGGEPALETLIHTRRGPLEITILERRFRSAARNYEVKFTCESGQFKQIEAELRRSLESFVEVAEPLRRDAT